MYLGLTMGLLAGLLLAHRLAMAGLWLADFRQRRAVRQRFAGLARERRKEAA